MASTSIYRNIASTGNADICTISAWVKRGDVGASEYVIVGGWRSSTDRFWMGFASDDFKVEYGYGGSWYTLLTDRKFRDPSAWYHIVLAIDSTQVTDSNREKLYINGVQETSFSTEVYMPQNNDTLMTTSGDEVMVGSSNQSSGAGAHQGFYKGEMSHVQFVDGAALAPTEFGEVDSTSGIWKIKTSAYATPGTNGFFLKMEDRTNLDLDSSSNALSFTTEGTLTATYDSPSNNFATYNPVDNYWQSITYSNGNNTLTTTSLISPGLSTLGMEGGKWYWEVKAGTASNIIGIQGNQITATGQYLGENANDWGYFGTNGNSYNNGSSTSYGDTYTTADIIGVAVDLDNNKLYFSKNGTFQNSGVPTSGATGTGALAIGAASSTALGCYLAGITANVGSAITTYGNFGNGYFGTTAVSSAQADDAGIGAMEYDVPAGYYCLCTKNIKAYG